MQPHLTTFQEGTQILTVWRATSALTHQPSICSTASTSVVSQPSSFDQQVMDQFCQMKNMLTSFTEPRQETIKTAFCNYLASGKLKTLKKQTLRKRLLAFPK